jgi:hypothetical protein
MCYQFNYIVESHICDEHEAHVTGGQLTVRWVVPQMNPSSEPKSGPYSVPVGVTTKGDMY